MQQKDTPEKKYNFPQKVWITGGIFSLIVVVILLLKATFSVFLLVLAGALIALFFHGFGAIIHRKIKLKKTLSLIIAVIVTILIVALLLWLIGSKIQSQVAELSNTIPSTIANAKAKMSTTVVGQKIIEKLSSPEAQQQSKKIISTLFKTTFGLFGDLYVVLFIGIFFTTAPGLYKKGIVQLVPPEGKKKAEEVIEKIGSNLQKWLKGKFFAMLVVFILTSIGLIIMGMPMWLVLALIAGLLNFIPNFGPLIAMIPAVLVALLQGLVTACIVAALYIVVQVIESNFITPTVQQKLISIPPALIIIAQLLIAPFSGFWGLILATPLMVIIIIIVQELYIKKQKV